MPNWKKVVVSGSDAILNNITATGDVTVQGDLIAENYIISSSVSHITQSFSSGSTIFGDTSDDTHEFTGSVLISGSLELEGTPLTGITSSYISSSITNNTITYNQIDGNTHEIDLSSLINASGDDDWYVNSGGGYISTSLDVIISGTLDVSESISTPDLNLLGDGSPEIIADGILTLSASSNVLISSSSLVVDGLLFASLSLNNNTQDGIVHYDSVSDKFFFTDKFYYSSIQIGNGTGTATLSANSLVDTVVYQTGSNNITLERYLTTNDYIEWDLADDISITSLTASSDISASGNLSITNDAYIGGNITGSNISGSGNLQINNIASTSITASSDISASGNLSITNDAYIGGNITGSGNLQITNIISNHITASGAVSSSDHLFASTSNASGNYNSVVVIDTASGQFYYTGSYGGGGGGGVDNDWITIPKGSNDNDYILNTTSSSTGDNDTVKVVIASSSIKPADIDNYQLFNIISSNPSVSPTESIGRGSEQGFLITNLSTPANNKYANIDFRIGSLTNSNSGRIAYQRKPVGLTDVGEFHFIVASGSDRNTALRIKGDSNDIVLSGSITASLPNASKTNAVYYDTTTGGFSYDTATGGGGGNISPRITYIYSASTSNADSVDSGHLEIVNSTVDYILVSTSSYNEVDLDGSSTTAYASFLYNEVGSMLTVRNVDNGAFRTYKITNIITDYQNNGGVVYYQIVNVSFDVSSGSLSQGDEVEFIWDKSSGVGGAYGATAGSQTKTLAHLFQPGYNYLDMFFGPDPGDFDGTPGALTSNINSSGSNADNLYYLPAISTSSALLLSSLTSSGNISASGYISASEFRGNKATIDDIEINADNITYTGNSNVSLAINNNGISFYADSGDKFDFNSGGENVDFRIGGQNPITNLFYANAGTNKIGIGIDNPSEILEVNGNVKLSSISDQFQSNRYADQGGGLVMLSSSGQTAVDVGVISGASGPTPLRLYVAIANEEETNAATIDTSGSLTIGPNPILGLGGSFNGYASSIPNDKTFNLNVAGTASIQGDITASGNIFANTSNANGASYNTLMVDTTTGQFYHTGSYGGGGGGGGGSGTVTEVTVGTGLDVTNGTTTPNVTLDLTEITLSNGLDSTATGLALDLSEVGFTGTANGIITSDNDGTVTTEADLTFSGTTNTLTLDGTQRFTPGTANNGVATRVDNQWESTTLESNGEFIEVGTAISRTQHGLYNLGSSGWVDADANSTSTSIGLLGIAVDGNSGNNFLIKGVYNSTTVDGTTPGIGDPVYISTTAKRVTVDAPSAPGDVVRCCGHIIDQFISGRSIYYKIYFNPSPDYIEN